MPKLYILKNKQAVLEANIIEMLNSNKDLMVHFICYKIEILKYDSPPIIFKKIAHTVPKLDARTLKGRFK